nr:SusC/RagA family TonB-linked outer membrane protein [Prevotella sp.]
MKQKFKLIFYGVGALILLPQSIHAQFVNMEGLDSLRLSGSVSVVEPELLKKGVLHNALDALSGQTAGVNVTTNGLDRIAMLNAVRVRGTTSIMGGNEPLVIIDGVTSDVATLATIYPADIESFTVLKNASETALYGSRGASGVIQVKTKKGTGKGFQISYESSYGIEAMYKSMEMLNAAEYIAAAQKLGLEYNDKGYDTNFRKAITRTGNIQNHYLAFSGGNPQSNYRASFGYIDHNTIIRSKGYRNLVAKIDVTQKAFNNRLTGDFGVFGSSYKNNDIFDSQMLFYSADAMNPTYPFDRENGSWVKNGAASQVNPPGILLQERNDSKNMNFNGHLKLKYDICDYLNVTAFGAYGYASNENNQFCPTWVWAQGNLYRGEFKSEEWLGNVSLNYQYSLGIHHLKAMLGAEYQKNIRTGFWTSAKGITNNGMYYHNIGAAASRPYGGTDSNYEDLALASVMGNIDYTLLNKYSLSVSMRGDGSSMVGDDHTWGFFPSISLSWDMKQEEWLRHIKDITMLKLRTGYGRSGNLGGISAYTTMNTVRQNGIVSVNSSPTVTMGMISNNNPDLKWETRATWNLGADLGLWNNRLVLTAEYYYSKTTDMLYAYDVPVPPFAYDKLLANIGSMSNQGLEIGFSFTPIQKKDMELNINMNLSWQKNKLLSLSGEYAGMQMSAADVTAMGALSGAGQHGGYNNVVYQIVGQPLGVFYLPHCKGLVEDGNGHYRYDIEDLDQNGTVDLSDGGDRYIAGQATPKVTLGSNISFRYRDWYLSLQMNGAFGHKIFNGTGLAYTNMSSFPDYNVLKGAPEKNIVDQNVSDYWLENGDYLNFEYLTLGYDIPIKKGVIQSLRVSASVNNLATITSYSGLTPMINSYVVNSTMGIDDKRTYPLYRTFSLGLSVQF